MILAVLLAAVAAAPQPAELKTFQDWTVGCDNGAACHAVALMPEEWPEDGLTMSVRRGPEAGAQPVLAFEIGADSNAASVSADGKRLAVRLVGSEGQTRVAPADTAAMIAVLRSAGRVELQSADGKPLGAVSLKGRARLYSTWTRSSAGPARRRRWCDRGPGPRQGRHRLCRSSRPRPSDRLGRWR